MATESPKKDWQNMVGHEGKIKMLSPEKWVHPEVRMEQSIKREKIVHDFNTCAESDIEHERLVEDEWVKITDNCTEVLPTMD